MKIPAAKKVALVGLSGSGKSTIINLLLRFFELDKGIIKIDDQNIRECSLQSIRENISIVTQETFLFNDTIKSNIKYGKLNATDEEIIKAAENAKADDFINELPNKYETVVGEGGIKLSGGQRQRIAIARAFLKDSPILLLDEATSSLDNINEKNIQKSVNILMKNRTSLIVTHRLTAIEDADLIYIIDKGKVVSFGQHKELIENNEIYADLYLKSKLNYEV